ncbi:MAG: hypothetical protein WBC91_07125 [Phototrophicaceae bacterium]
MLKRFFLIVWLMLFTPIFTLAQDADDDLGAYLRLNSNFSVPEITGWDVLVEGETVLFSRDDIDAQIYVRIVDTLDTTLAIDAAIADVEQISLETDQAFLEGRIGRNNGTWNYRIFEDGDTSVTAYALLQSNQVYVVLFAEQSPDYNAYHLAKRSTTTDVASEDDVINEVNLAVAAVLTDVTGNAIADEPLTSRNPVENNALWIESTYAGAITTASYYFTREDIIYITVVEGDGVVAAELSDAFDSIFLGFVITPDNGEYLLLGLIFSAVIMLALIGSMFLRYQNFKKDLLVLEQLAESDEV